jgi:membrane protease YdiL (CAAX protease family)
MEQIVMAVIALLVVVAVRRKEVLRLRWQPDRHTWVALGTGVLAALLSASLLLLGSESVAGRIVHYGGIYVLCGLIIPWGYTLLVERQGPAAMGLRRERWLVSLIVSIVLAGLLSLVIVFQADWAAMDGGQFARALLVLGGAGGLFELFLYYGFIHLRLEKALGPLPAILLTAAIYVPWHTGTQLPLEADPWAAVVKLLAVGVLYQSVFSLTRNLLVIWPFFHGVGVMIDFAVNIGELERVSAAWPWACGTLALMAAGAILLAWAGRRVQGGKQNSGPAGRGSDGGFCSQRARRGGPPAGRAGRCAGLLRGKPGPVAAT